VIGVSGGCDSSYLVHELVNRGLRPLAVHFDNTWNSPIATQNIYNVLNKLNVDLFTIVADNKEFDDIFRSFLYSGVKECDAATDIALTTTLYLAAEKYKIKYIIEGHSFRTEGIAPLGWAYMDGKFVSDIHKRFGRRKMKTFPNLTFMKFLKWSLFSNVKRIRPLYYLDYNKEQAKKILSEKYGWVWYGGHHLENRISIFAHTSWLPFKHNNDQRILGYSALVRSRQLSREEGFALLSEKVVPNKDVINLIKDRLELSDEEFQKIMDSPNRHWSDYKTYKRLFERLKWLFWILYKLNRVPKSFYIKFANKSSLPAKTKENTSVKKVDSKSKKILFLGNADNVNLRLCLWSRAIGVDACLWRTDEVNRGNPSLYEPSLNDTNAAWFVKPKISGKYLKWFMINHRKIIKQIERDFDVVVVSGWQALIISKFIRLPKILVPIGYEVSVHANVNKKMSKLTKNEIAESFYRFHTRKAIKKIDRILDSYTYHLPIYKNLNIESKVVPISIGCDCNRLKNLINPALHSRLLKETRNASRVFFWLSRVDYKDIDGPNYKGFERFWNALNECSQEIFDGEIIVYIGTHGVDYDTFAETEQKNPLFKYIKFVAHLDYPDLLAYISLPNAVVFTDFGENNDGVGGIGRDAIALGTVSINSTKDAIVTKQYGAPYPRLYALEENEIAARMREVYGMSEQTFSELQEKMKSYALEYLDYKNYMNRFYAQVDKVL